MNNPVAYQPARDLLMFNTPTPLELEESVRALRQKMKAVILAHYYQEDDIQDIADYVGDSLELSRRAAETDAEVIVFCGVRFMAETAKILNPEKTVLLPDMDARCSLEIACSPQSFRMFRQTHPDHVAISYINCSAQVKAESDVICTSSNAEEIIRRIPENTPILFAPDKYLGSYLERRTGRKMTLWNGTCVVHERFSERQLVQLQVRYPNAHVIAHPECPEALLNYAHTIGSTSKLLQYTQERPGETFLVLTEPGIIHQMKKRSPGSIFIPVGSTE